jgi:hypothetical protein
MAITVTVNVACTKNSDLTRGKAKKILEKKINGPEYYKKFPSGFVVASTMPGSFGSFSGTDIKSATPDVYRELQERGMVTLTNLGQVMMGERFYVTFPDDVGKKYVKETKKVEQVSFNGNSYTKDMSEVLLAHSKVRDITGITEPSMVDGRKVCFVDFDVEMEKTPFGEVMLPDFMKESPIKMRAEFVLYDDGWRVTNKVLPVKFLQGAEAE